MNHLDALEAESIYILREVAAQFRKPALLFSGGKDSTVIVHLAKLAFHPDRIPFPLVHVDTEHNFAETIEFRDKLARDLGAKLIVRSVGETIKQGKAQEINGSRNAIQSVTLLDTIAEFGFDGVIGGARRDEEKARAKERIFSFRNEFGQWEPRDQRPELWNLFNGRVKPGEHMRVFPLSNWTELDIWHYIQREQIELPSVYFSHRRACRKMGTGMLLADSTITEVLGGESIGERMVRCRTVGDLTCTGLVESTVTDIDGVIREILASKVTERGSRADDRVTESAMEDRKKRGYF
jgi:sulfate adenylyltransferase subunit 2